MVSSMSASERGLLAKKETGCSRMPTTVCAAKETDQQGGFEPRCFGDVEFPAIAHLAAAADMRDFLAPFADADEFLPNPQGKQYRRYLRRKRNNSERLRRFSRARHGTRFYRLAATYCGNRRAAKIVRR